MQRNFAITAKRVTSPRISSPGLTDSDDNSHQSMTNQYGSNNKYTLRYYGHTSPTSAISIPCLSEILIAFRTTDHAKISNCPWSTNGCSLSVGYYSKYCSKIMRIVPSGAFTKRNSIVFLKGVGRGPEYYLKTRY